MSTSTTKDYKLFTLLTLDDGLALKNRIVVGSVTRARAGPSRVPNELPELYYEQHTSAGLVISEATAVFEQDYGWYGTAALYRDEHAAGWRKVVDRVHARGGKVFLQLWHMGRQSHSSFNPKGEIVSASATRLEPGRTRSAKGEHVSFETARALETSEIPGVVEMYRACAERAKLVGFDGVEIHGANGYIADQFLQSCTKLRMDAYGGSFENRALFLFEIVKALKTVWPADRIGGRLSPNGSFGGMGSADNFEMFTYVMERLSQHGLVYLAILHGLFLPRIGATDKSHQVTAFDAKKAFKGVVVANNSYTRDTAEGVVRSGSADLVGFACLYMSNPDLVERFENNWPLNADIEYKHWWDTSMGAEGCTSFPTSDEAQQSKE